MRKKLIASVAYVSLLLTSGLAGAFDLNTEKVASGVYALIGETGPRTTENLALSANSGFVVTEAGVVLIDSGASPAGAALIERAIRRVTDQPVKWVVNTGSQDHRWLGNDYFASRGAKVIALQSTVEVQQRFVKSHLKRLEKILEPADFENIKPVYAEPPIKKTSYRFVAGQQTIELHYFGDSHFPGDAVVWLPDTEILFSGDLVYLDRLLGVHPWSDVRLWQKTYHSVFNTFEPKVVVPGHGSPAGIETVQAETGDYLDFLVEDIGGAAVDWEPLSDVMEQYRTVPEFEHLKHFDDWHPTNVNRTYLQFEGS